MYAAILISVLTYLNLLLFNVCCYILMSAFIPIADAQASVGFGWVILKIKFKKTNWKQKLITIGPTFL